MVGEILPDIMFYQILQKVTHFLSTCDLALVYHVCVWPIIVTVYADAAFGNELAKRCHYEHAVYLSDCLVWWLTKAITTVCLSTSETEYIATELGFHMDDPSELFEDNQSCVTMVNNHVVTCRNHHFCVKMVCLREQVVGKVIRFAFVTSHNNLTDIFIKILAPDTHDHLAKVSLDPKVFSTRGEW